MSQIDSKWLEHLELKNTILEIADDLWLGVPSNSDASRMASWRTKYVEMKRYQVL